MNFLSFSVILVFFYFPSFIYLAPFDFSSPIDLRIYGGTILDILPIKIDENKTLVFLSTPSANSLFSIYFNVSRNNSKTEIIPDLDGFKTVSPFSIYDKIEKSGNIKYLSNIHTPEAKCLFFFYGKYNYLHSLNYYGKFRNLTIVKKNVASFATFKNFIIWLDNEGGLNYGKVKLNQLNNLGCEIYDLVERIPFLNVIFGEKLRFEKDIYPKLFIHPKTSQIVGLDILKSEIFSTKESFLILFSMNPPIIFIENFKIDDRICSKDNNNSKCFAMGVSPNGDIYVAGKCIGYSDDFGRTYKKIEIECEKFDQSETVVYTRKFGFSEDGKKIVYSNIFSNDGGLSFSKRTTPDWYSGWDKKTLPIDTLPPLIEGVQEIDPNSNSVFLTTLKGFGYLLENSAKYVDYNDKLSALEILGMDHTIDYKTRKNIVFIATSNGLRMFMEEFPNLRFLVYYLENLIPEVMSCLDVQCNLDPRKYGTKGMSYSYFGFSLNCIRKNDILKVKYSNDDENYNLDFRKFQVWNFGISKIMNSSVWSRKNSGSYVSTDSQVDYCNYYRPHIYGRLGYSKPKGYNASNPIYSLEGNVFLSMVNPSEIKQFQFECNATSVKFRRDYTPPQYFRPIPEVWEVYNTQAMVGCEYPNGMYRIEIPNNVSTSNSMPGQYECSVGQTPDWVYETVALINKNYEIQEYFSLAPDLAIFKKRGEKKRNFAVTRIIDDEVKDDMYAIGYFEDDNEIIPLFFVRAKGSIGWTVIRLTEFEFEEYKDLYGTSKLPLVTDITIGYDEKQNPIPIINFGRIVFYRDVDDWKYLYTFPPGQKIRRLHFDDFLVGSNIGVYTQLFEGEIDPFKPELNLLKPSDFGLLANLDSTNYLTLVLMISMWMAYMFVFCPCCCCIDCLRELRYFFIFLFEWTYGPIIDEDEIYKPEHKRKKLFVCGCCVSIIESHEWLNCLYIRDTPKPCCSHSEKLVLLYILVLGSMASNALTYGLADSSNEIQWILTGISSNLVSWIPIFILSCCFSRTGRCDYNPPPDYERWKYLEIDDDDDEENLSFELEDQKNIETEKRNSSDSSNDSPTPISDLNNSISNSSEKTNEDEEEKQKIDESFKKDEHGDEDEDDVIKKSEENKKSSSSSSDEKLEEKKPSSSEKEKEDKVEQENIEIEIENIKSIENKENKSSITDSSELFEGGESSSSSSQSEKEEEENKSKSDSSNSEYIPSNSSENSSRDTDSLTDDDEENIIQESPSSIESITKNLTVTYEDEDNDELIKKTTLFKKQETPEKKLRESMKHLFSSKIANQALSEEEEEKKKASSSSSSLDSKSESDRNNEELIKNRLEELNLKGKRLSVYGEVGSKDILQLRSTSLIYKFHKFSWEIYHCCQKLPMLPFDFCIFFINSYIIHTMKRRILIVTILGVVGLLFGTIVYFSAIFGLILAICLDSMWIGPIGIWFLVVYSILLYFLFYEYLFLRTIKKINAKEYNQLKNIFRKCCFCCCCSLVVSFILFLIIEALFVIFSITALVERDFTYVLFLWIGQSGLIVFIFVLIFNILLIYWKKKEVEDLENPKRIIAKDRSSCCKAFFTKQKNIIFFFFNLIVTTNFLPCWCIPCWFCLGHSIIFVFSIILVVYGIRFVEVRGIGQDEKWLLSCLVGFAQNIFVDGPIGIIWKVVLFSLVFNLFHDFVISFLKSTTFERKKKKDNSQIRRSLLRYRNNI